MVHEADQQLFTVDAASQEQRQSLVTQNQATTAAYERRFSQADAIRISNFGRAYLNGTPEIAAAMAESQLEWDMPGVRDLMLEDAIQQDGMWSTFNRALRGTSRVLIAGLQSAWDEGIGRQVRTDILQFQGSGETRRESWMRAGSSYLGQAARDLAAGRPIELGTGYLPAPVEQHERPGFTQQMLSNLDAQGFDPAQGIPPDALSSAFQQTSQEFFDEYGYSTVQRAWDSQEATVISKTRNGRTYSTPFSFGRAPALQVFTPGTIPFNMLSGFIDITAVIGADPLNIPAWKVQAYIKARQLFQPMDLIPPALKMPADELVVPGPKGLPQGVPDTTTKAVFERVAKRERDIKDFNALQDRVRAAEKTSDPANWSIAEKAAYARADYAEFSRLRGYSPDEIADFQRFIDIVGDADPALVQRADGGVDAEALFSLDPVEPLRRQPKAPSSGAVWDLADDIDELRRVQNELDELGTPDWGMPTDGEIAQIEEGIAFSRERFEHLDRLEELETIRDVKLEKLATAGIYIKKEVLSVQLLDELGQATRGVKYIEFTDVPARGQYAIPEDVGAGADGYVFHGSERLYDPDEVFHGGISTRADRAGEYAMRGDQQGFVSVYNRADLPESVTSHLDTVGDAERVIHLPAATPKLTKAIDDLTVEITGLESIALDLQDTAMQRLLDVDPLAPGGEFRTPSVGESAQAARQELPKLQDQIAALDRERRALIYEAAGVPVEDARRIPALETELADINNTLEFQDFRGGDMSDLDLDILYDRQGVLEAELDQIRPDTGKIASGLLGSETVFATTPLPDPVAVYPVVDFLQATKAGRLKIPGPDVVIPPKPPPTPTNPTPIRPLPDISPTGSTVGIVDSWRPFTKPITVAEWMRDGKGARLIEFLTDVRPSDMTKILADLPVEAQKAILRANGNPAEIAEIIGPHFGYAVPKKPKVPTAFARPILGATVYGDNLASAAISRVSDSPVGRTYRMLGDTTEALELNPHDTERTLANVVRRMEGWGVPPDKIDEIWWVVANADGSTGAMHEAALRIADLFEDRLLTKRVFGQQYDPFDVRMIMTTFLNESSIARRFNDDLTGNPILPAGSRVYKHTTQTGLEIEILLDNAHLDSEFAHSSIFLPAGKETRRALSGIRVVTDQFRRTAAAGVSGYKAAKLPLEDALKYIDGSPLGLRRSRGQIFLDYYLAGWRNFALLRLGWVARYLPDEALRFIASGEINTPASLWVFGMQHGIKDLNGNILGDVLKAQGLGAASFIHHFDDTVAGSRFDASRTSWSMVGWGQPGAKRGLVRDVNQINKSILAQTVMERGLDDAFTFFKTPRGKEILRPISRDAVKNSRLAKMIDDDGILLDVLAEAEMRTAKIAGSQKWIYRNQDDGIWRNAFGEQIDDYTDLEKWPTVQSLRDKATELQLPGRSKPKTREEMRAFLLDNDGYSMLVTPDPRRNFYTMDGGSPRARKMMRDGLGDDGVPILKEEMNPRDWTILEETYPGYIEGAGYEPPPMVKVPNLKQSARLRQYSDTFTDAAFRLLGQAPTVKLIRSPYAKTVYTDEIARMYLFADQATRGRLLKWADEIDLEVAGFRAEFDLMIRKQMGDRGMTSLPKGGVSLELDAMDSIAKSIAVESSRDLFYDLSKTHNWADLSRIMWPFADAWWEVISRWTKLMNPSKNGGRAMMNWRRLQQAALGTQQSGWFEEDSFGNEVFKWFPQFGTALPFLRLDTGSEGVRIKNRVQLSNLLFVDPSDPGSVITPGFSPAAQVLASVVEPLIPVQARDEFRRVIFGDFAPPDLRGGGLAGFTGEVINVHAPTWLRRLGDAWNAESNRTASSTFTVKLYEAYALSRDPLFEINSKDDSDRNLRHAQALSGRLNIGRFIDGLFGPVAQGFEPEFWTSMKDTKDPAFWMNTRAVAEELRAAEEWLGTEQAAIEYILDRYGFNPLDTGPSTVFISDFPTGKEGFQYLQENPDIGEFFPNTMMIWIPEADDVAFYRPSWEAAKEFGARIDVTELNVGSLRSATNGNYLYEGLVRERDSLLEQAAIALPPTSARYAAFAKEVDNWFGLETLQLGTEFGPYWAWGFDRNIGENGATKATPRDMLDEVSRAAGYRLVVTSDNDIIITEERTEASAFAAELNPEIHGFVRYMMSRWQEAEAASARLGFRSRWWRSSEAQDDGRPEAIRQWYLQGLQNYILEMPTENGKLGAQYIAERIITPLMAGFDFGEPLVLYTEAPSLTPSRTTDTLRSQDLIGAPNG